MSPPIDTLRNLADLAEQLARLPDDVQVSAGTAALLVCVDAPPSERTMEGWRQGRNRGGETGPPFHSGPGRTSAVSYNVGAVRAWVRQQQASTTMEVANRRGLSFASIVDLARPEPWVMRGDYVLGHALTVDPEDLWHALNDTAQTSILVGGLSEVMKGVVWVDPGVCEAFHRAFAAVLVEAQAAGEAVVTASVLHGPEGVPQADALVGLCPRCGRPAHASGCRL